MTDQAPGPAVVDSQRPLILCVDDDERLLRVLTHYLRPHFTPLTATGGAAALALLREGHPVEVIVSDMRMPGMDGAAFLAEARHLMPEAVRVLLTGHSDVAAASAAVNDGQIFRFLIKPCRPPTLIPALRAAVDQHRLLTAERVLLERTVHGCIDALTDVLALANPTAFGRALHVKALVTALADQLHLSERWQIEVAAMLGRIGMITLPQELVDRLQGHEPLSEDDLAMLDGVPAVAEQLLAHIPRLEPVRDIIAGARRPYRPIDPDDDPRTRRVQQGAHLLRLATDFDDLDARDVPAAEAIGTMRARTGRYDPVLLDALERIRTTGQEHSDVREMPLSALRPGMVVADDVWLTNGLLLVARGYTVTQRFVDRAANMSPGSVVEPVRAIVGRGEAAARVT